jgi:hypothetical protein
MTNLKILNIVLLGGVVLIASACSKKESAPPAQAAGKAVVDTNQKAEPVKIADTNHHLFFRPAVGSVERFRVVDRVNFSLSDQQAKGPLDKHSSLSTSEYYLRQTVKAIGKDSSVELSLRIDSVELRSEEDTSKVQYSSGNKKDRANDKFQDLNIVLGKEFTIKADKYGDLTDITDVNTIATAFLATLPDSVRTKVKPKAIQHAKSVVNSFISSVLIHCPTRALVKDTTWHNVSEVNFPVSRELIFPVTVDASETVHGLEKRGDKVLAVLEDQTTTAPKKKVFEEGPTKTTLDHFAATSHSVARIEDATGVLFHRVVSEVRHFIFVVENKEHPEGKRTITQDLTHTMTAELVE